MIGTAASPVNLDGPNSLVLCSIINLPYLASRAASCSAVRPIEDFPAAVADQTLSQYCVVELTHCYFEI